MGFKWSMTGGDDERNSSWLEWCGVQGTVALIPYFPDYKLLRSMSRTMPKMYN